MSTIAEQALKAAYDGLKVQCIYDNGKGKFFMGPVNEEHAVNDCSIILSSYRLPSRQYAVIKSRWDDINEAPIIQEIVERVAGAKVTLLKGRQAVTFESESDEVFCKLMFEPGTTDA